MLKNRKHSPRQLERDIEELFDDEEFIDHAAHPAINETLIWIRNIGVLIAVILFLITIFNHHLTKLRAIAYFCGAGCYFLEIVEMTNYFRKKTHLKEMFMVYCFGPLYILMGISYLLY